MFDRDNERVLKGYGYTNEFDLIVWVWDVTNPRWWEEQQSRLNHECFLVFATAQMVTIEYNDDKENYTQSIEHRTAVNLTDSLNGVCRVRMNEWQEMRKTMGVRIGNEIGCKDGRRIVLCLWSSPNWTTLRTEKMTPNPHTIWRYTRLSGLSVSGSFLSIAVCLWHCSGGFHRTESESKIRL